MFIFKKTIVRKKLFTLLIILFISLLSCNTSRDYPEGRAIGTGYVEHNTYSEEKAKDIAYFIKQKYGSGIEVEVSVLRSSYGEPENASFRLIDRLKRKSRYIIFENPNLRTDVDPLHFETITDTLEKMVKADFNALRAVLNRDYYKNKPKKSKKKKSTVMYLDDALSRMSNRLVGKGIILSAFELEKQNQFIVHVFQVVPFGDGGEMAVIDFDGDGKDIKTQTLGVLPAIEALQKIGYVLKEKIMN